MIKSEKAITLISLAIYIIGLIVIMRIVGSLLLFYNNNVIKMNDTSDVNMELSKFTAKMIDETKEAGNTITEVAETTIKFSNGNVYTFQDNKIYENSIVVSQYVKHFMANLEIDGNKKILRIYIVLEKGAKEIIKNLSYVIEQSQRQVAMGPTYTINVVEPGVYGNLYKISDTEYHLIFNARGVIAEGYTKEQLVAKGTDIKGGSSATRDSEEKVISNQPWGEYSGKITKVKIEEEIRPISTANYFVGLSEITEIEKICNIDTSNVTNMMNMFQYCSSLTSLDISKWNTGNVTNMNNTFNRCSSLTSLDINDWNTEKVTNMNGMFYGCGNLISLNLNDWNTENVISMSGMFYGCTSLTEIYISKWNTSKVEILTNAFGNCSALRIVNISNWNTDSVTNMNNTFLGCSSLTSLDINCWNTEDVTNMNGMFRYCSSLTKIYVGDNWIIKAETQGSNMFDGCTVLSGAIAYDSTKKSIVYANCTTGYLTYKASQ